ncbi:MAG: anhydro-N-acetylmuramic acid kinase [Rhodospirillales bacterium]|nr:anhydro-N-acetylmuramic acid kinase [Rhodospirillales bacterium]
MMRAIGLMSGTSLDGVDAALVETDGLAVRRTGHALTLPYDDATRETLRSCLGGGGDVPLATCLLTLKHAEVVTALLAQIGEEPPVIDVIGLHGQTIVHRPAEHLTWQIGDGALLAHETGIDVVSDFRSRDMAAGGEGAPLAPLYHAALVRDVGASPVAVLNIGGVANVTWIDSERILAFDTGPGGALLDDWVQHRSGARFDRNGELASGGRVHQDRVETVLMDDPYFRRDPPKSLDRDAFRVDLSNLSNADGAATLVALTAEAVAHARAHLPIEPALWIVCGGGRHNDAIMAALRARLPSRVMAAEDVGWDGDSLEAEAFAFLAVRALKGLPLSLPTTTGCKEPVTGGALHRGQSAIASAT